VDTRQLIINISRDLFSRYGYEGVSIRMITDKAKVNLGAITYHFGGKENLYTAVIQDAVKDVAKRIFEISEMSGTPDERLLVYVEDFMYMALKQRNKIRLILREMSNEEPRALKAMEPFIKVNFRNVNAIIEDGIKEGIFHVSDSTFSAYHIISLCTHAVTVHMVLMYLKPKEIKADDMYRKLAHETALFAVSGLKQIKKG